MQPDGRGREHDEQERCDPHDWLRRALEDLVRSVQPFLREGRSYGEWVTEGPDGSLSMPWVRYDERVHAFVGMARDLYSRLDSAPNAGDEELLSSEVPLASANLPAVLALVLHADRAERFCDGALLSFLQTRLPEVVARLSRSAQEASSPP